MHCAPTSQNCREVQAFMKALVTGGTGFVGSHIVRVLNEVGHDVRVLHRTTSKLNALEGLQYESAIGDVTDLDSMREAFAGCDWIFHVAAVADYWRADTGRMFEVNVEGTRKVLQAARETDVKRVIFTSSAAAVGIRDDGQPADENVPFNLSPKQFPYGYSKVLAEQVVQEAVEAGQDVVTVNPSVIIGPGDLNMISGTFIVQTKRFGRLMAYTSGGIGVIDVRDVAGYHLAAAQKGVSGERYILNTVNYRLKSWFDLIADTVNVGRPILYAPNFLLPFAAAIVDALQTLGIKTPLDANQVRLGSRFVWFNGSKSYQTFGEPQVTMRQSIEDSYSWYVANDYLT